MNGGRFQLACLLTIIALALTGSAAADGFDPVAFRSLCRDLGVALGPGYHQPPCWSHLRRHYEMAIAGHPLPASRFTPLYWHNGNRMHASRYVPWMGASYPMPASDYPAQMPAAVVPDNPAHNAAPVVVPAPGAAGGELHAPAVPEGPVPRNELRPGVDKQRAWPEPVPPSTDTFDNQAADPQGGSKTQQPVETQRHASSVESRIERFSPDQAASAEGDPKRRGDPTSVRDSRPAAARRPGQQTAATAFSPVPEPWSTTTRSAEATRFGAQKSFEDVQVREDLVPVDTPR